MDFSRHNTPDKPTWEWEEPSTGSMELSDRAALRRVSSLSTELEDVTEAEYRSLRLERVILVGVWSGVDLVEAEKNMEELAQLAKTAGSTVLDAVIQRRDKPDKSTYIGQGKAQEVHELVIAHKADTVICDGELTGAQLSSLEKILNVKVIDRTALILDIFAQHAVSKEGKAQVSLAQMQYMIPRLRGWGESLSRQSAGGAGGVGLRGPGETKIETDRRRIRERMSKLRHEIAEMKTARTVKRASRSQGFTPRIAIAGYTNAGKSSLLNALSGAGVLVENALFATLDPTNRTAKLSSGLTVVLSDTVGFVNHLPHQLVDAFASTLEEIIEADLIVHLVDGSDTDPERQINVVSHVLAEISENTQLPLPPEIIVINKTDRLDPEDRLVLRNKFPDALFISLYNGEGVAHLQEVISDRIESTFMLFEQLIPYNKTSLIEMINSHGIVYHQEYEVEGTRVRAKIPPVLYAKLTAELSR